MSTNKGGGHLPKASYGVASLGHVNGRPGRGAPSLKKKKGGQISLSSGGWKSSGENSHSDPPLEDALLKRYQ